MTLRLTSGFAALVCTSLFAQKPHELINATLWAQTAFEHDAITLQTFRQARLMLDRALKNKSWTAAVEQTGNYRNLPLAIVVDVDETIVDNSAYEGRRIYADDDFELNSWNAWVREAKATALPGSVEFAQYAKSRGVRMFYVTNRESEVEEATIRNPQALGFAADASTVMCKGEQSDWGSDKSSRRKEVARQHRILLLMGDDYGDFLSGARQSVEQRRAAAQPFEANWGVKWLVLPNPMYGSWEGALYGFRNIPRKERLEQKWKAIDPKQAKPAGAN
jgi:5'-nucleotidase (lipoprotein e(P4) family)